MSRLARLRKDHEDGDGFRPDMPPLIGCEYLLGLFFDIGPTMSGAMGSGPLTHGEIESAQRNLRIGLSPWDCRMLRRLSIEYLNESQRAEKRDAKAPWQPKDYKPDLLGVAKSMQKQIAELANL